MRQVHVAGEHMFVAFAGRTGEVVDANTGEIIPVQIFVAVLGALRRGGMERQPPVRRSAQARGEGRLPRLLATLERVRLLIIDDWRPEPLSAEHAAICSRSLTTATTAGRC